MSITKLGKDGVLKYGAAGASASTDISYVRDVTIKTDATMADTSSRASIMDTEEVAGLKISIDFEMINRSNDSVLTALLTAANAGTPVALLTQDYTGGRGWDGDFNLSVENGQPFRGEQTYKFTATASSGAATPRTPSYS